MNIILSTDGVKQKIENLTNQIQTVFTSKLDYKTARAIIDSLVELKYEYEKELRKRS